MRLSQGLWLSNEVPQQEKVYKSLVAVPLASRGYVFEGYKSSLKPSQNLTRKINSINSSRELFVASPNWITQSVQ